MLHQIRVGLDPDYFEAHLQIKFRIFAFVQAHIVN